MSGPLTIKDNFAVVGLQTRIGKLRTYFIKTILFCAVKPLASIL